MARLDTVLNFDKFPNSLIGGTTGYGKTHFVRHELAVLISKKTPDELKLAICYSKVIDYDVIDKASRYFLSVGNDFAKYSSKEDIGALLQALIDECNRRIQLFSEIKCYGFSEYKRRANAVSLPEIILVVDDLTSFLNEKNAALLASLTSLNRSVGINIIAVTSQISSPLITRSLRSNFTLRMCFKVMSAFDSKKVLGYTGAELLSEVGAYLTNDGESTKRTAPWIEFAELELIVASRDELKSSNSFSVGQAPELLDFDASERDQNFEEAARLIVMHQQGSTSLIQRKLKLGYNQAGRIIDQLEAAGIVGPFEGYKVREVLIPDEYSLEQFLSTLEYGVEKTLFEYKQSNELRSRKSIEEPKEETKLKIDSIEVEQPNSIPEVNHSIREERTGFWVRIGRKFF